MTDASASAPNLVTREFIIQPTSFCNINCDYCYLPNRQVQRRMDNVTLARICETIFSSSLLAHEVKIVWHAGEPMTLPISFYEEALRLCEQYNARKIPVRFFFRNTSLIYKLNTLIL